MKTLRATKKNEERTYSNGKYASPDALGLSLWQ
jgi:hypothetical protein